VCFAQDPNIGTWKFNEAKSHMAPGVNRYSTVVYEVIGDNVKVTQDGTDKDGKPVHLEWTGKVDGKEYPVTGNPTADSRSLTKIDDHTFMTTNKKNGEVVVSARSVISADGKTRTVHITQTAPDGKKLSSTAVYDKQ
jgi:hypothetical protein